MIEYQIFISSSDSYSDLWPIFFDLFKKHWPEYTGKIYLNTEEKTFQKEGLQIICTKVGHHKSFGATFLKGLETIQSNNVLLIMIDYLLMGKTINEKMNEYYKYFSENNIDSLCLTHQNYPNVITSSNNELYKVLHPAPHIMFSFQIAFWKKSILRQMVLPHESPWTAEWFGTLRAEKMEINLYSIADKKFNPIPYNTAGCLHKGKWLSDAVNYLKSINYNINFDERGYFKDIPITHKNKIQTKWPFVKDGIKGSYWDLHNKKKIGPNIY